MTFIESTIKNGLFQELSCTCSKCVQMCKHSPCIPTVDQARELIKAGYGDRLAISQVLLPHIGVDQHVISGKGTRNPDGMTMQCNFLTPDGKCELHDLGLKPLEGRLASCKHTAEESFIMRKAICKDWDTQEAYHLMLKFISEV